MTNEVAMDLLRMETAGCVSAIKRTDVSPLIWMAKHIVDAYTHHRKILICGNGGSAADAQHFAAELCGRFLTERKGIPAISLTADSAVLTAISNDYGYDKIFARQVSALGQPGDVLIAITTSGRSPNIIDALIAAKAKSMTCLILTGIGGKLLTERAQHVLIVDSYSVPRIQEVHGFAIHAICMLVDELMGEA